jgi:DNA-binding response OmpR family regulator
MTKESILIVEPDEDIGKLLQKFFTIMGYRAQWFADAGQAIVRFDDDALPDAMIVANSKLPFEGYDDAYVPVLMARFNAHASTIFLLPEHTLRGRILPESGHYEYMMLTKPFDVEQLELHIRNMVALSKGRFQP